MRRSPCQLVRTCTRPPLCTVPSPRCGRSPRGRWWAPGATRSWTGGDRFSPARGKILTGRLATFGCGCASRRWRAPRVSSDTTTAMGQWCVCVRRCTGRSSRCGLGCRFPSPPPGGCSWSESGRKQGCCSLALQWRPVTSPQTPSPHAQAGGRAAEGGADRSLARPLPGSPAGTSAPHLPDIVHSTVLRWAAEVPYPERPAARAAFGRAAATVAPVTFSVSGGAVRASHAVNSRPVPGSKCLK